MAALLWPIASKSWKDYYSIIRWRLMPRTHPSPSRFHHTVETALVLILRAVPTHSSLPFKDDASDQYEKRDIVRGYSEVSGDIFL